MGRERASINIDIWGDSAFRDLTVPAQALYFKLMSHPKLDYCGVVEFHPGRLASMSRETTAEDIMTAASELSDKWWCVFDQSTDEVMVRGFLRHDGVLLQPRLAVSAAKAYAAIASNKIRAVVVHEVKRFKRENPGLAAWDKPQMITLLKQESADVRETVTDLDWAFLTMTLGEHYARRFGQDYAQASDQTSGSATTGPTTATATSTPTATSSNEDALERNERYPQVLPHPRRSGIAS